MELPVAVGDLVAGKYRVEERIGSGAMGIVFAARHEELGERVALKFLNPIYSENDHARTRFQREARNTFALKSEHVARVLDVGKLDAGEPYIVMEFLDGKTLRAHVEERGTLSREESLGIIHQICKGVAEAHASGIIHRDLKAENVFITRLANGSPIVKVLDFGISKATEEGKKQGGGRDFAITAQDQVLGTPRYMAPEQFNGGPGGGASTESDVWSLGVLFYWLLSGKFPYDGGSAQETLVELLASRGAADVATLVPDLDPALARVVMKCLARSPGERFKDADALRRAVLPFARSSMAMTKREPMPPTQRSAAGPDLPTLDEPPSPRVTDAVLAPETVRQTDRLPMISDVPPELADPEPVRAEANPDREKTEPLDMRSEKAESVGSMPPIATPAVTPAGSAASAASVPLALDNATQRRITLKAGNVKPSNRTLPLGMVYSTTTTPEGRHKSESHSPLTPSEAPPASSTPELPEPAMELPLTSAGRTRVVLVLGFFAFVAFVVWLITKR
jgi:serine/threonine-protein kinase